VRRTMTVAAIAASCLVLAGLGMAAADEPGPEGKLPEPALRFAKDASLRVTEMERDWQKLADGLAKDRPDFARPERKHTESSLREEATRLLASAKKLLDERKRIAPELERFKDALKKSASHYREVAALYKFHAEKAKSGEVKDDYHQLAKVYELKAEAAANRAGKLTSPEGTKAAADVIEEGNLFIERLLETLAVGPIAQPDCDVFAGRLRKHGQRCQALSLELSGVVEKVLGRPVAIQRTMAGTSTTELVADFPHSDAGKSAKEPPAARTILGASWSSPVTVRGTEYRQVLRFNADGTCTQSVYRTAPTGLGALLGSRTYTYKLDPWGSLSVYAAGELIEWGKVTVVTKDRFDYDIVVNVFDPGRSASRITFVRHDGR